MKRLFPLMMIAVFAVGITACSKAEEQQAMEMAEEMMAKEPVVSDPVDPLPEEDHGGWVDQVGDPGQYTDYIDGVVGNGMTSVLFYHASWCPKCRENHERLTKLYSEGEYPISVYKLDYDTADAQLKSDLGVVQQDSFVKVDGNGNVIDLITFPSLEKLTEYISA